MCTMAMNIGCMSNEITTLIHGEIHRETSRSMVEKATPIIGKSIKLVPIKLISI